MHLPMNALQRSTAWLGGWSIQGRSLLNSGTLRPATLLLVTAPSTTGLLGGCTAQVAGDPGSAGSLGPLAAPGGLASCGGPGRVASPPGVPGPVPPAVVLTLWTVELHQGASLTGPLSQSAELLAASPDQTRLQIGRGCVQCSRERYTDKETGDYMDVKSQ